MDLPNSGAWRAWMSQWIRAFGQLAGADHVRLRMSHSRQPTCPKFHVDGVHLRLIATLSGPGTQWLPKEHVEYLPDGGISQVPEPDRIEQMPAGSVGLFCGARFDQTGQAGVVHRSPPEHTDRVVLILDIAA